MKPGSSIHSLWTPPSFQKWAVELQQIWVLFNICRNYVASSAILTCVGAGRLTAPLWIWGCWCATMGKRETFPLTWGWHSSNPNWSTWIWATSGNKDWIRHVPGPIPTFPSHPWHAPNASCLSPPHLPQASMSAELASVDFPASCCHRGWIWPLGFCIYFRGDASMFYNKRRRCKHALQVWDPHRLTQDTDRIAPIDFYGLVDLPF